MTERDDENPPRPGNPVVVERITRDGDQVEVRHLYWCLGCDSLHAVRIREQGPNAPRPSWIFTGTLEKPTYEPSQLTTWGSSDMRCHTFIRDGQIQYLDDCTHRLRGRTILLPPLPDWVVEEHDVP